MLKKLAKVVMKWVAQFTSKTFSSPLVRDNTRAWGTHIYILTYVKTHIHTLTHKMSCKSVEIRDIENSS